MREHGNDPVPHLSRIAIGSGVVQPRQGTAVWSDRFDQAQPRELDPRQVERSREQGLNGRCAEQRLQPRAETPAQRLESPRKRYVGRCSVYFVGEGARNEISKVSETVGHA